MTADFPPDLIARLRAVFPDLPDGPVAPLSGGFANAVLLVAGRIVVRVPRFPLVATLFPRETAALAVLRGLMPVAVPEAVLLPGTPPLVAYPLLPGHRMRAVDATDRVAGGIAAFLATLHAVPVGAVLRAGVPIRFWTWFHQDGAARLDAADLTAGEREKARRLIAGTAGDAQAPTVVHHDLNPANILVDGDPPQLSAVIDFTDLSIEDPHWDFWHFPDFGEPFLAAVVERYRALTGRTISLDRIRMLHHARPAIELVKSLAVDDADGIRMSRQRLAEVD